LELETSALKQKAGINFYYAIPLRS
jgi:hypothetical protein